MTKIDKSIISLISQDIPLVERPFARLAGSLGIKESFLFRRLKGYKKAGLMRKFSATLNHRKIGFRHNAMVVWNIPNYSIAKSAKLMADFSEVSHCYQRKKAKGWNYNLYSMIHARTRKNCLRIARDIARKTGCRDYKLLFSSYEFKKSPAKY